MSALAFTLVALALVGPVPAVLARAAWPLRAPRAAITRPAIGEVAIIARPPGAIHRPAITMD